jgi:hypothetical protein
MALSGKLGEERARRLFASGGESLGLAPTFWLRVTHQPLTSKAL